MFGDCVFPYVFIDASTEEYEEEAEVYEEEEEHFDNCTNQGKLIPCRLLPMQVILMQADILQDILMQVILVQISKSLPWQFIYWRHFTYPKFLPCKLLSKSYNYSWPLSESSITTRVASTI